jgi:hypothetical protein
MSKTDPRYWPEKVKRWVDESRYWQRKNREHIAEMFRIRDGFRQYVAAVEKATAKANTCLHHRKHWNLNKDKP